MPAVEQFLTLHPQLHAPLDLVRVGAAQLRDSARVVPRLRESGYELDLVVPDHCRGLFQPEVGLEPAVQQIRVAVPPARRIRLPDQVKELGPLRRVMHTVEGE
jgi:hypothetical protein